MPRQPKDGGAVFVPRSFAESSRAFGSTSSWLTSHPISAPQQEAAELQHAITNKVREYLLEQNTDLAKFCRTPDGADEQTLPKGLSYDRFQRIMRGETMLTLTDLMYWASTIPGLAEFIGVKIADIVDAEHVDGHYTRPSAKRRAQST